MGLEFSPVLPWRLTCRERSARRESPPMLLPLAGGGSKVVTLGELMMPLALARQGLRVPAVPRKLGQAGKAVRRYLAGGVEPPPHARRPHQEKSPARSLPYLRERLAAFPGLTAVRLWRELRERGYAGG